MALPMLLGRMQLMRSHRIAPEPWIKDQGIASFPWEGMLWNPLEPIKCLKMSKNVYKRV